MAIETIEFVLKEWAVVERALLAGRQTFLLRKGGIIEETGEFRLEARKFLLMPTFEHAIERPADIQPQYQAVAEEEIAQRPDQGIVRFHCLCEVTDIVQIVDDGPLSALADHHVFSASYLRMRVEWEPYRPLFALIVRAYKLQEEITIQFDRSYGGCKSWVRPLSPVRPGVLSPVLGEQEFQLKRDMLLNAIGS